MDVVDWGQKYISYTQHLLTNTLGLSAAHIKSCKWVAWTYMAGK